MRFDHKQTGNTYLVVRKSPSPDAPFAITSEKGIEIVDGDGLSSYDVHSLAKKFRPGILYLSGWADPRFKKVALDFKKQGIPVLMGMDNHWLGNFKQKIASFISYFLVRRYCTHIWIPGNAQLKFAHKLGFSEANILKGLYCADDSVFSDIQQYKFKKQITFVGRLVDHKGAEILFDVIRELILENTLDFEVKVIGNGPLSERIPKHKNIQHLNFVNPQDLPKELENAGFFILPSLYEAWGVVVHEAVLAGLPVITTHQTGAASQFVDHGTNGFIYDAYDKKALKNILLKLASISEDDYQAMSFKSKEKAQSINLSLWSSTLNSVH